MRNRALSVWLMIALALPGVARAQAPEPVKITFEEAIDRALKNNPGVAEAAQAKPFCSRRRPSSVPRWPVR
jgi:hypothetical protein